MKIFVCLFIIVALASCEDLESIPGVPQSLMNEARCALKDAVPQLQRYNTGFYCRFTLHQKLKKAVTKLQQINKIIDVNNLVIGNNNAVSGEDNVIIGSNNNVDGDDNWLISMEKFNGKIDKTLVFRNWQIKMDRIDRILCDPRGVIKILNRQQKNIFTSFLFGNKQQQGGCKLFFASQSGNCLNNYKQPSNQNNQKPSLFGLPNLLGGFKTSTNRAPIFGCFGH